jgi:nucleoside-diphosphate-sugar epimerase
MSKIAILGATGYIAKSLIYQLAGYDEYKVSLFSRSKEKVQSFLDTLTIKGMFSVYCYDEFKSEKYDAIINCTGIGDPIFLKKDPTAIFKVTEEMDEFVLSYLQKNPDTFYINLSSGAAYAQSTEKAIQINSKCIIDINNLVPSDFYGIAKVNSEAKHRSMLNFNIVDLRIFSFFSQFIDPEAGFFMSEIISCIKNKKILKTSADDMVRDYVGSQDLLNLIILCIKNKKLNDVFDVYTLKPIAKFELLDFFKEKYGLTYEILITEEYFSPTGKKIEYLSNNHKAESLGYLPVHTSLSGIESEMKLINFI